MGYFSQDLRYGLRTFLKTPGATLAAVLSLALGIGATSSVFSVVNGVLLRPLPFQDPDRLVAVWGNKLDQGRHQLHLAPPDYRDVLEQNRAFERMGAFRAQSLVLVRGDLPEQVEAAEVSPSVFEVLGVKAERGRLFAPDEDQPAHNSVVILSDSLWRRFGHDTAILGSAVTLGGKSYTVIGVAPAGFRLFDTPSELWIPYTPDPAELASDKRGYRSLAVAARLKPGISIQQAGADVQAIAGRIAAANPDTNAGYGAEVVPLAQQVVGNIGPTLWTFLSAVTLVLLIACANVANLLLVRAGARDKEIAVRTSLGASPRRIVRQLLTESLLLALVGGALGLGLASGATSVLVNLAPANLPRAAGIDVDWHVLLFTLAASVVTGIIFGLAPALVSANADVNSILKTSGRGTAGHRTRSHMRDALVVAEIASCVVLLIGAGLLTRSFLRLLSVNPGFRTDHVLTMRIAPSPASYQGLKLARFYQHIIERVSALPGVDSAGMCRFLPLTGIEGNTNFQIEGQPPLPTSDQPRAGFRPASAGYFRTLGIPLLRGRDFDSSDDEHTPKVAIINQEAARLFWPHENPLGKRILSGFDETKWSTIVGVVGNLKHSGLDAQINPEIYYHYLQIPPESMGFAEPSMVLVIRSKSDPALLIAPVTGAVRSLDPDQPVYEIRTMQEILEGSVAQQRFRMLLISVFAGLALLLASIGLYGVIAYSVTQRFNELGVRIALGAQPADILSLVLGRGLRLAAVGIGAGLVVALVAAGTVSKLLFGVTTRDPVTFGATVILILAVTLLASLVPAVRATKVDPAVSLRAE